MTTLNDTGLGLAKRMKIARQMRDLDQAQIAEILGVARTTVSTWERGETEPSATNFVLWAQVTGQPLEWLAEGVVRPKGLEPPTFCSVVGRLLLRQALCLVYLDRQVSLDSEIATPVGVA